MSEPTANQLPRLPRLAVGPSAWYLPLNDYAVSELSQVLVSDDLGERETSLAHLMSVDPVVALWTACAVAQRGAQAVFVPTCVMDLAQWLARHARHALSWTDDELDVSQTDNRRRWRELAADAVAVANLAAESVTDDDMAAETFLLGLLHNAADWLKSCGPRVSLPKQQTGCLPDWLAGRLRERSRAPRSEPLQQIVRAVKAWRDSGRRSRRVEEVDVTDALWARRRWQAPRVAAEPRGHTLAALTKKLQRLEGLEHEFERALEQEKLASLGELAYGASHEINNPLANISTRAQALLADERDPERRRMLAIINTQAFRANEMIADMMLFARPPELACAEVDLIELVDSLLQELADEAELQGTQLQRRGCTTKLCVTADATQLAMALRAVMVNALQALGAEGEIEVTIDRAEAQGSTSDAWARIAVSDTGPGIPPAVRRHLFDPFYSGREAGRGLGFGLAKCWRIVSLHRGRIDVQSQPRQGTTITIWLPAAVETAVPSTGRADNGESDE